MLHPSNGAAVTDGLNLQRPKHSELLPLHPVHPMVYFLLN